MGFNADHLDDYACNVTVKKGVSESCQFLQERQTLVVVGRQEWKQWGRSETNNFSASLNTTGNMMVKNTQAVSLYRWLNRHLSRLGFGMRTLISEVKGSNVFQINTNWELLPLGGLCKMNGGSSLISSWQMSVPSKKNPMIAFGILHISLNIIEAKDWLGTEVELISYKETIVGPSKKQRLFRHLKEYWSISACSLLFPWIKRG